MRRAIIGLIAVCVLATAGSEAALAADIPVYKARPAPVALAYNWTGFYLGAHVGYGWARNTWTDPFGPPFDHGTDTGTGWLGGLQLGYNHQIGNFVLGIEGQYSWAKLEGSHNDPFEPADVLKTKTHYLATIAGRIGYAFDRTLIYGKGGWARVRNGYAKVDLGIIEGLANTTRSGWILGAGAEYAFMPNWSVRLEYNYFNFGTNRVTLIDPTGGPPELWDMKQTVQTLTVGVNYKFMSAFH